MGAPQQDVPKAQELETSQNFVQRLPDSHSWTNLNQVVGYIDRMKDQVDKEELARLLTVGLRNTQERGYDISLQIPVEIKTEVNY